MLFNSISFILFFPLVVLFYYLIPHKFRYLWLLAASYYFYMCWNASYALLLLFSTAITYAGGLILHHLKQKETGGSLLILPKKLCVGICLFLNLSILFVFKYFHFFMDNLNSLFSHLHIEAAAPAFSLLLPVGISFYIFQALGYIMDIYRGKTEPEKNFFRYALFVSFFPQLVAGPIERSSNLLPQFREKHKFSLNQVKSGLLLMLWGYFLKMVIADRIALFVDTVYGDYNAYPGTYLIVATLLFAFQIYCDFYGYSTIALGAAQVMGFQLMENFQCPYFAKTIGEFWRRWHISLTSWFKDYLYIPLGGSRKGVLRKYLNVMIIFLVSGLWHGASWTFLVWGFLNGAFQIIGKLTAKIRSRMLPKLGFSASAFSHRLLQTVITFGLVDFTWIFFRANSFQDARNIIYSMLTVHNPWILLNEAIYTAGLDRQNFTVLLLSLAVLFFADCFKKKGIRLHQKLLKQELWFQFAVCLAGIAIVLTFGIWGTAYDSTSFIYFQF